MTLRKLTAIALLGVLAACTRSSDIAGGPAPGAAVLEPECAEYNALRTPHFGELHLHTKYSTDAYLYATLNGPQEAYSFARGEEIGLPPYDAEGHPSRKLRLDRPLDFAAVTDHSEGFGFMYHCLTPGSAGYDALECRMVRKDVPIPGFVTLTVLVNLAVGLPIPLQPPICRLPGVDCEVDGINVWQDTQAAAEAYYDRSSDCRFTTFVGYEWSASPAGNNIHRNVIFRNHHVPDNPISTYQTDGPYAARLWQGLKDTCLTAGTGCDVLAIPHNSNISGGWMFPDPANPDEARTRAELETLVEIYQHKGSSECRFDRLMGGVDTTDELCAFEQLSSYNLFVDRIPGLGIQYMPALILPQRNYLRNTLKDGLKIEQSMGVNPFKFGFIGSTDSHNATPGATEERRFAGHVGTADATSADRVSSRVTTGSIDWSPGGLAVVWSEQNNRDSLFEAMRRRETYATSGTRPVVRFFGGWDFPANLCEGGNELVAAGYRDGTPMGGDLRVRPANAGAPRFAVSALMDPGARDLPGTPLQRIQIIKGWVDGAGRTHEKVFDVAGDANNGASVDPASCDSQVAPAQRTPQLCTVWSDPDFDAGQSAFYYARVLENPSCRWSTYDCKAAGVDPFAANCLAHALSQAGAQLQTCCLVEPTQQERAWTSPIWYRPAS